MLPAATKTNATNVYGVSPDLQKYYSRVVMLKVMSQEHKNYRYRTINNTSKGPGKFNGCFRWNFHSDYTQIIVSKHPQVLKIYFLIQLQTNYKILKN